MDFWRIGRTAMIILGVWLFASAFLWPHAPEQRLNAAVVGAAVVAIEIAALEAWPWIFVVDVALSIWLFVALWVLPGTTAGLMVNNMLVAVLMFGFSVIPPTERDLARGPAWRP
jgi:hypothetical protein